MRFQPLAVAKALSWTAGILYAVCSLVMIYFPDFASAVAETWYREMDTVFILAGRITLESFITGLITVMASAWITGYLFAGFANYFSQR